VAIFAHLMKIIDAAIEDAAIDCMITYLETVAARLNFRRTGFCKVSTRKTK